MKPTPSSALAAQWHVMKRPPIIGSQTLKKYRGPRDIKAPSAIVEIPDMILFFKLNSPCENKKYEASNFYHNNTDIACQYKSKGTKNCAGIGTGHFPEYV
jgi:hypothetical protein